MANNDRGNGGDQLKICLQNIVTWATKADIESFLKSKDLAYRSVSKVKGKQYAFIGFNCQDSKTIAFEKLKGAIFKGNSLKPGHPNPKKSKKRPASEYNTGLSKRQRMDPSHLVLQDRVIPLWRISYNEQLNQKEKSVRKKLNVCAI